ncbi:MAG TPA: PKD domain-containing protein [Verrucomicrobiae bacterium]|nr:PKD domain-containing protein [Verrucomicrobiae bacterium]
MRKSSSTKTIAVRNVLACAALFVAANMARSVFAQTSRTIRVVEYNIQADTTYTIPTCGLIVPFTGTGGSFTTSCSGTATNGGVLEGIGEEIINGDPAQPIDILALNETTSNTTTVQPIVNALNTFYLYYTNQHAGYAMSPYQATESGGDPASGNGPNALVYNTNTLQLLASVPVDPPGGTNQLGSASGEYREVMRYEFAPTGVTAGTNNEFYVYVSHYKASSGSSNDKARLGEATIIRSNEYLNLPATARVLYVGDYNVDDNSGEAGYQTICSNGVPNVSPRNPQGQGVDPLNILWGPYTDAATNINWSSSTTNTNILFMLSEESYERRYRDDFQVMTSNVYYDVAGGLQYVQGSYHLFGNNGSFTWGNSVNVAGNTALNDLDPVLTNLYKLTAAVLLEDLTGASDHLPTVADYTIPVGTATVPPVAGFTASPTSGVASLTVNFTDTSSNTPTSWAWTFGDTGTSTLQNPSHTYTTPGTYSVGLIASNAGGSSTNTQTNLITVLPPPPVASFTAAPTNGAAPLNVNFVDASSGSVTGWAWTFGDGNTSISQSPSDMYVNPGSYTVREIVFGNGGSSTSTVSGLINVYDPFAWWQIQYFGGTNYATSTAPGGDYTGTGMSNTNKFLAGFNPTNPAAYLHVIGIMNQGNTNVMVTYLGPNGDNTYTPGIGSRTNVLDFTTGDASGNYTNGGWQDTGQTNILGGGNGSGIVTDMTDTAVGGSPTNRYYRVRVLLP